MGSVSRFVVSYLFIRLFFHIQDHFLSYFLVGCSFGTVELSDIVTKMHRYIEYKGEFRYGSVKYHFVGSGRGLLLNVLATSYLDTVICFRWQQYFSFECREIRKRKGCGRTMCPL